MGKFVFEQYGLVIKETWECTSECTNIPLTLGHTAVDIPKGTKTKIKKHG